MSSREIAELTGKEHKNVIRDIRGLIEQGAINQLNFEPVEYTDAKGEKRPEYLLDFDATMTLVTGYNAVLRAFPVKPRKYQAGTGSKPEPSPTPTCPHFPLDISSNLYKLNLPLAKSSGRV